MDRTTGQRDDFPIESGGGRRTPVITVGSNPRTKALEWATTVRPAQFSIPGPVAPTLDALREAWRSRSERLSLALVAVPLAEVATGLTGHWWAWPVLLGGAWACTRTWRWTWLLSIELGAVGVMWATV